MIKLKSLLKALLLAVVILTFVSNNFELEADAQDVKVELNQYVDPIKDLGIKPLLVTLKLDNEKTNKEVDDIIADTPEVEVKQVKNKTKAIKRQKSSKNKLKTENNVKVDELVIGLNNRTEVERIAKKTNKKIKNVEKLSDTELSNNPNKDLEVVDLMPLINDLYPSKEAIDKINNEILEEARFEKKQLKKMKNKFDLKGITEQAKKVVFDGVTVKADQNTSNEASSMVIYGRMNQGLVFDIPNANITKGQPLQLWDRWTNYNSAQRFYTFENSSKITPAANQNLCLERYGNNYNNGTPITLWDCNDSQAQQWKTYPDGSIRPLNNSNKCIDGYGGLNKGSKLVIHDCHFGGNQNWRMGINEEFGSTRTYELSILAAALTPDKFFEFIKTRNFGHALVVLSKNYQVTNTFASNGSNEGAKDINKDGEYSDGRSNNMKTWDTLNVDGDVEDWPAATGKRSGYSRRTIKIPKTTYDTIKYMRGWDIDPKYREYRLLSTNCATYARDLFNKYTVFGTNGSRFGNHVVTPALILNTMPFMESTGY